MTTLSPYRSMDGKILKSGDIAYQISHAGPITMILIPVKVVELMDAFKRTISIIQYENEELVEEIVVSTDVCVDPLILIQDTIDRSENFIDEIMPRRIMQLSLLKEEIEANGNPKFVDSGLFGEDLEI